MAKTIAYIGVKGLPSKAGADRVVEAIVRGVNKEQYRPVVYCSSRIVPAGTTLPGVRLVRIPTLPGKHLHATSLFLFAALHALFLGKYTLVHMHNVEACFVSPLLRLRYNVIATSHGPAQARDKWGKVAKRLIRLTEYPFILFSNAITSVSQPLAARYEAQYKRPVHYFPNGVDENPEVDLEAARRILDEHGVTPERYILFAAGRVIPTKGCEYLLQAMQQIDDDVPVLVVGDTSQVPVYEKWLHQLADRRVHFCPFVGDKSTLLGLVQMARLFVFPSTVEAMSMMLLEAASVGTPIVCSDIPENASVLPDEALFFRSADVADLRQKLQWAMAHPQQMAALAAAASARVNAHFRWQDIIGQYERLYGRFVYPERFASWKESEENQLAAIREN